MLVYFSASTRDMESYIDTYRNIIKAIRSEGHNISNDWIDTALLLHSGNKQWNIDEIVKGASASIQTAELMIAEASDVSTFGVGYEVSLALQYKKPVLLLIKEGLESTSYANGLDDELLTCSIYNDDNLEEVIIAFLSENTLKKKDLRFNFVIDRQIHNHLRRKSYETGMTKAEVVRDLLQKDMQDS